MRVVFVGQRRILWRQAVLYLLTLGIYRRVWLYRVNKEIDGHAALGLNHRLNLLLLVLPIIGPTIVTYRTAKHCNNDLHAGAPLKYGPTGLLWLATWIPVLGNLYFMLWTQDRLNRYWDFEKDNTEHGIDIDLDLEQDKGFIVELRKAQAASYEAGSRFDRKKEARREKRAARRASWGEVQQERHAVRSAGGSTPVLPWRRPQREAPRNLHITCGRCEQEFDVTQDPFAETPILCPKCGLHEVLPSLRGDALAEPEPATFAGLEVDCPKCKTHFHALRDLHDKTDLVCYSCGHKETLPAPKAGQAPAA